MNRFFLICATSLSLPISSYAQPASPLEVQRGVAEAAPEVDADAQKFVRQMVARYAALKSYSDVTQVRVENAAGEPVKGAEWMNDMAFRATLQWERPNHIRFEGENAKGAFLALGTDEITRVTMAQYPDKYIARPRNPPMVIVNADGTRTEMENPAPIRLQEPLMGSPVPGGPGLGFLLDPAFWKRSQKDVRSLGFEADARVGGKRCRVVRAQILSDDGSSSVMRLFVAETDGLLRRLEIRDNGMPADTFVVEKHSEVRANAKLPAATWDFEAPANAKPVDYFFVASDDKYQPDIQIGDALPVFSGDALDGKPLELNPQSGKVTIVHFFTLNSGVYDVQILNKLARIAGLDEVQIIGVSADALRPRVEAFAARYKLNFPIYFDESGRKNALIQKFGVKLYASTFVFGADGKLQGIGGRPGSMDSITQIQQALPDVGNDFFILQDNEIINAQ